MSRVWLLGIGLMCPMFIFANDNVQQETPPVSLTMWKSEVELGYQAHRGNTDNESLNTRLGVEFLSGRHRTYGEWKYYNLYKNGEQDKRQHTYSLQSDYKLGPKAYLYSSYRGSDSKYSAYFKDHTISGGLGYQLYDTEHFLLELEGGPGYRYQEPNLDEIKSSDVIFPTTVKEAIFRGNLESVWTPIEDVQFGFELTVVAGSSNTRTDTEVRFVNNITEDIALKISHNREYHDKVPEGVNDTDTVLKASILLRF